MALIKCEKIEKNAVELTLSIAKDSFEDAIKKVYKKKVGKINVPGYRPGKAPMGIIEKMYGKGVFYEDAIDMLLPEAYESAVKEADITPVSRPEFDIESIEGDVVLKAKVYVKPEVEIEDYVGLKAEKKVEPVTDEQVDHEILHVRERNAREVEITDRPAALEDTVKIDYEGFVDGVPFEGGKGEGHDLKLGSGQFIPGFEDQIVGKNIGDEFDVNVTFPTEYHAKELAGKPAVFKTKLHAITVSELPAEDDEFAKDVSEFDTLAEYKADIKAKMEKRNDQRADSEVEGQLADALIAKLQGEIPEPMIETEIDNMLYDYEQNMRAQGLDMATYLKYTGMKIEDMRAQFKPNAERQIKLRLAFEKIAEKENLEVTDEKLEEEYKQLAEAYNMDVEKIKASLPADMMKTDLILKVAADFVKEHAEIKTKKATAKKTAAKKAAAPKEDGAEEAKAEEKPAAKKTTAKKTSGTASTAKKTTAKKSTAAADDKKDETAE